MKDSNSSTCQWLLAWGFAADQFQRFFQEILLLMACLLWTQCSRKIIAQFLCLDLAGQSLCISLVLSWCWVFSLTTIHKDLKTTFVASSMSFPLFSRFAEKNHQTQTKKLFLAIRWCCHSTIEQLLCEQFWRDIFCSILRSSVPDIRDLASQYYLSHAFSHCLQLFCLRSISSLRLPILSTLQDLHLW